MIIKTPVMYGRKKGSVAAVVLSSMVLDGCRTEDLVGGDGVLIDEDDSQKPAVNLWREQ